ncbi:MAG: DUF3418 domain-containing protein, partial [Pseudomonadota bacterium]
LRCAGTAQAARASGAKPAGQPRFTRWDFGPLTAVVRSREGGLQLTRYPALADLGDSVRLETRDTTAAAEQVTVDGIVRLFRLRFSSQGRFIERRLLPRQEGELLAVRLGGLKALAVDLAWLSFHEVFVRGAEPPVVDAASFDASAQRHGAELAPCGQALADLVLKILRAHHALRMRLPNPVPDALAPALADLDAQLDALLGPGFLRRTPVEWLACFPRYLNAAAARVERLPERLRTDAGKRARIAGWWRRWQDLPTPASDAAAQAGVELRWMIEEYRVSLFAQALGTRFPVSERRLERLATLAER